MKKVLLIYAVLIAGILIWYYGVGTEKKVLNDVTGEALKVGKHSPQFNQSMEDVMSSYYKLTGDFIKEDTNSINKSAGNVSKALGKLKIDELKKDSDIYETAASIWDNAKTEINGMIGDPSLQAKRESLNLFSNELFTLLLTIRYDLHKLYWQECSSAFGDDTPGNWLSESEQSKDPYGKDDCATVKKVIDFIPVDSTKK
jgi:hypothetical protein